MNIFLRRIPANTKHAEISEFVAPALNRGLFKKAGRIIDVEILALQDTRIGTIEYHGLVTLDSDAAVQSAVRGLKNRRLNGRLVIVRPYYHRSWYNDPRQPQNTVNQDILEKRRGDRRRGQYLQIIKNVSDRFNSQDDFYRTISHQQFLMTLVVPGDIEEAVAKFIAEYENQHLGDKPMYSPPTHETIRLATAQEGSHKDYSFQIHAEKKDIMTLLEKLKNEFSGSGMQYWIVPVVDKGEI